MFGIIVSGNRVNSRDLILERVKKILQDNQKKFYQLIISKLHSKPVLINTSDKISETKLQSFPEISTFVLISCPFSSLYDLKDFYKPVVTPYELEIAFENKEWKNYIEIDLPNILREELDLKSAQSNANQEEEEFKGSGLKTKKADTLVKK